MVAEVAKELGILTVAVVTKPFKFERRSKVADKGLAELVEHVDSLITIPNQKLHDVLGDGTSMKEAFAAANNVLLGAVKGIADLIILPGMINVDFADVRTVMSEMGSAMMGTGRANGSNRARDAAEAAIRSPLLDDIDINGARGILVNVAGADLTMGEFMEVGDMVEEFASENATVVVGTVIDESLGEDMMVTIVATGLDQASKPSIVIDNDQAIETAARHGNYDDFDTPPHARNPVRYPNSVENVDIQSKDLDYLDVPAFLRRQAD